MKRVKPGYGSRVMNVPLLNRGHEERRLEGELHEGCGEVVGAGWFNSAATEVCQALIAYLTMVHVGLVRSGDDE